MVSLGQRMKDPSIRGWAALVVLVLVVGALAWPFVVGRDARHLTAYSDGPEDLSRLRAELDSTGARIQDVQASPHVLSSIPEPSKTVLLIIGPERRFDASETADVLAFLHAGGQVVLADETGFGSDVARDAGYAFSSQRVLDTNNYRGDPRLVTTTASGLGDGAEYRLVLNAPASLVALSDAQPADTLASSSAAKYPDGSYVDTNGNGVIDIQDQPGPFPLLLRTHVGAGTLVLVSDTGLFMNAQLGLAEYDNARFARALVASLVPTGGTIVLDESRHAPTAALAPYENAARALGRATGGPIAPFVLLAALVAAGLVAWRLTRPTDDWRRHKHAAGPAPPLPDPVRPDLARAQRMARHRISERLYIALAQVAAMKAEGLVALCVDKTL